MSFYLMSGCNVATGSRRVSITIVSRSVKSSSGYSHAIAFSTSSNKCLPGSYRESVQGQPYTGYYEPGGPTRGPLGQSASTARVTPKRLKTYLDKYVIGQDRPKKTLSVAIYSHYMRMQEIQRQAQEDQDRMAKEARRRSVHEHEMLMAQDRDMEAELKGTEPRIVTVRYTPPFHETPRDPLSDTAPTYVTMEKANILCLGPTGVGKTHTLKTLAKALEVPFSLSDCTPFTQAGYVGEDASVCVERLLVESGYDVEKCEGGIICLDEVDKLASTGGEGHRDVSGRGVQQALLKIIEGTTLTFTGKDDRGSMKVNGRFDPSQWTPPKKVETYNVRTDNILFIFTGAFSGLQKLIMNRVSKGSMGFGADVRDSHKSSHQMTLSEEEGGELFKNLPHYTKHSSVPPPSATTLVEPVRYNPLDLTTPADLQEYGMLPEFLGRIPVITALSPFSVPQLMRILTEPRNSIISQYKLEFSVTGTELDFTTLALWEVAKAAEKLGTGARALRGIVENVLAEAKFEVPGSSARYVLVTGAAARREVGVSFFSRGCAGDFRREWDAEEKVWREMVEGMNAKMLANTEEVKEEKTEGTTVEGDKKEKTQKTENAAAEATLGDLRKRDGGYS